MQVPLDKVELVGFVTVDEVVDEVPVLVPVELVVPVVVFVEVVVVVVVVVSLQSTTAMENWELRA